MTYTGLLTQSNLQDWGTCRRRFYLRYIKQQAYPAPETQDMLEYEQHLQQGDDFHRIVHQHQLGIDEATIAASVDDERVAQWWQNYLDSGLPDLPGQRYAETPLTAPLGGYRLLAKYDLIAIEPGKQAVIVDWKTSQHRPRRETLANRMQTVVYRYLLVEAGTHYNGGQPLEPEQIEMVYWFADYPTQPERFPYSAAEYAHDKARLAALADEIAAADNYPRVLESEKDRVCRYCVYRTLCWDDVSAGPLAEMDVEHDDLSLDDLDLDQIAEIAF